MPDSPNTFGWYELMTTDMAAAETFYAGVLGWRPKPWGPPGSYTLMHAGEAPVAGVMPLPGGGGPGWVGYIGVADVESAAARAAGAGASIHRPPADIPEIGRFAVLADPQGAVFVLFTPTGEARPPFPMNTPGHIGWHELYAADGPAAFDFYAGQFGWTKSEAIDMGPMGIYQLFAAGDAAIGGMMTKPPNTPAPAWAFYVNVPAADAAAARVAEHGGQVLMAPHQVPGGSWIAQCRDPQGALFAVVAPVR